MFEAVDLNFGDDTTLTFGKYKGRNVIEVYEEDPDYIEWVYNNLQLSPGLELIISNLVETGCPF